MDGEGKLNRRGLFGAAAGAVAAAALGPLAPSAHGQACPDPVAGSVTASGSINRKPLTLVDAYSDIDDGTFQRQLFAVLTSVSGGCAHYRENQVVASEQWLVITQVASRSDGQLAPFAPGTYTIGVGTTDADGTLRTVSASYTRFGKNCSSGGQQDATSGTVMYTAATDLLVEASFDLWFGADHVSGSFSAPRCVLCAPRPATRTCLKP